ncbi:hypothetical protein D3C84_922180 [compost metagenome]
MLAVAQVGAVDIQAQMPALDIHLHRAGSLIKALERAQAQGGIAQLLVNLSGCQGRHGVSGGMAARVEPGPQDSRSATR